jgi:hypothetical protein
VTMGFLDRLRRRLFPTEDEWCEMAIAQAWREGIGAEQAAYDMALIQEEEAEAEALEDILEWVDHTVYTSRTPYGLAAFVPKLYLLSEEEEPCETQQLGAFALSDYQSTARLRIAEAVRCALAESRFRYLVLVILRLGDAIEAVASAQ